MRGQALPGSAALVRSTCDIARELQSLTDPQVTQRPKLTLPVIRVYARHDHVNQASEWWSGAGPNRRPSAFQAGRTATNWPRESIPLRARCCLGVVPAACPIGGSEVGIHGHPRGGHPGHDLHERWSSRYQSQPSKLELPAPARKRRDL